MAGPQFVDDLTVARVLAIAPKTLRNWRVAGRGPPFSKLGSLVRYDLAKTIAWAEDREVASTSEL